ncbi:MAG: hypothetical protein IPK12_00085 [Gemmatimonadetes bacterium]|nr:hypothetical protein [Gemmatimonadota bacterium]
MWALDARLDSVGIRHHIGWFDGVHAWPGAADLAEAVEWMHLQAMRRGLLAADRPWIDALYRSRLGDAAMMRAAGASYRAWRRFRAIETDFAGLHDIAAATEHRRELERQPGVFQAERHLGELVRQQEAFNRTLGEVLGDLRRTSQPLATSWRRLGLDGLVERARDPADTMGAHAARRALEQVWVYTSFYEPREHLVRQDPRRALALLAIAERLRPADPAVALYRAEALARLGRSAEAREALVTAARGGRCPKRSTATRPSRRSGRTPARGRCWRGSRLPETHRGARSPVLAGPLRQAVGGERPERRSAPGDDIAGGGRMSGPG